jgi:hypothetical protein
MRKTPQSPWYWVSGCLPQQQDAIRAWCDPGESNLQLFCKLRSHLQWIAEKGVGVKRPWWGKEFCYGKGLEQR